MLHEKGLPVVETMEHHRGKQDPKRVGILPIEYPLRDTHRNDDASCTVPWNRQNRTQHCRLWVKQGRIHDSVREWWWWSAKRRGNQTPAQLDQPSNTKCFRSLQNLELRATRVNSVSCGEARGSNLLHNRRGWSRTVCGDACASSPPLARPAQLVK